MTLPTEDQIEAARTKVRNMLHAADHGNHLGEMAVLRMAASGELVEALEDLVALFHYYRASDLSQADAHNILVRYPIWEAALAALSLAQPYEAEVEKGDGLQTNVAPQCGVGPSDLTGQTLSVSGAGEEAE